MDNNLQETVKKLQEEIMVQKRLMTIAMNQRFVPDVLDYARSNNRKKNRRKNRIRSAKISG